MNDTMQIIRQDELGETEVLKLTDVPIPEPGIGEIVVRVHAAGV
jgi:NADPH:quinone reductase-like Zn-dependent oxidoreductase